MCAVSAIWEFAWFEVNQLEMIFIKEFPSFYIHWLLMISDPLLRSEYDEKDEIFFSLWIYQMENIFKSLPSFRLKIQ